MLLHIDRGLTLLGLGRECIGGIRHQLLAPLGDLVRADVEALRELGERHVALDRGQGHFGLERS